MGQGPVTSESGPRPNGPWSAQLASWTRAHPGLLTVVVAAVASRIFFILIALLSAETVDEWPTGTWHRGPTWVQPFARWDSGYYLDIATDGYGERLQIWAFHPGYPMTIRALTTLLPGLSPEVAGFAISNACFLAAIIVFFQWTAQTLGTRSAVAASVLVGWSPASFFFSAVYPESMFFLFTVLSLWAFQRERWAAAGLLAAVASGIRPQGLFLAPAFVAVLALAWIRGRRPAWTTWLAPVLTGTFAAGYSAFAWSKTGDPLYWLNAREQGWPDVGWRNPLFSIGRALDVRYNFGLPTLGFLLLAVGAWHAIRRLAKDPIGPANAAYAFTIVLLVMHTFYSAPPSMLRYSLAALSVFWTFAANAPDPRRLAVMVGLSAAAGACVAFLFATWRPAL